MIGGLIEKHERISWKDLFPIGWPLGSKTHPAQNIVRLEVGEVSGLKGRPRRGCLGVLVRFGKTLRMSGGCFH